MYNKMVHYFLIIFYIAHTFLPTLLACRIVWSNVAVTGILALCRNIISYSPIPYPPLMDIRIDGPSLMLYDFGHKAGIMNKLYL